MILQVFFNQNNYMILWLCCHLEGLWQSGEMGQQESQESQQRAMQYPASGRNTWFYPDYASTEKQLCWKGCGSSGRQQGEWETCPCGKENKCFLSCISKSTVLRLRQVITPLSSALVWQMWSLGSSSELSVQEIWMSWSVCEWPWRWLGNRVLDLQGESGKSGSAVWRTEGYGRTLLMSTDTWWTGSSWPWFSAEVWIRWSSEVLSYLHHTVIVQFCEHCT